MSSAHSSGLAIFSACALKTVQTSQRGYLHFNVYSRIIVIGSMWVSLQLAHTHMIYQYIAIIFVWAPVMSASYNRFQLGFLTLLG